MIVMHYGLQPAPLKYRACVCRSISRQQHTGGKQIGMVEEEGEGSAPSFNGVRAVPGVDGDTVYAAFLGTPAAAAPTAPVLLLACFPDA